MVAHPLQALVDQPLPDLTLSMADGSAYPLRQHVGRRALALFFYVRNGTPG